MWNHVFYCLTKFTQRCLVFFVPPPEVGSFAIIVDCIPIEYKLQRVESPMAWLGDWCWWCWACRCSSIVLWVFSLVWKVLCGIFQCFLVIVSCMQVIVWLKCCFQVFSLLSSAVTRGIPPDLIVELLVPKWLVLPHSVRNVCRHCVRYVNCLCLSCTIVAMLIPVFTSIAVSAGMTCLACMLMYAESHCTTFSLLVFCCGWLFALPLLSTQIEHHDRYAGCVKLCSLRSCSVGCCGALMPFAGKAACCVSSSSVMYSSLYVVSSSKFVDPVDVLPVARRCCDVHCSSNIAILVPSCGFMNETLSGLSFAMSGPCCVCCGMYVGSLPHVSFLYPIISHVFCQV